MNNTWLITGGSRSGKSRYALNLANNAGNPYYIATGWAGDDEMEERIRKHQLERGEHWTTIETRTALVEAIDQATKGGADYIIIDCITFWVSNLMMASLDIRQYVQQLTEQLPEKCQLVMVTNELGCSIVPENKLARQFRDEAGWVNQQLAAAVDHVVFTVCGMPIKLK